MAREKVVKRGMTIREKQCRLYAEKVNKEEGIFRCCIGQGQSVGRASVPRGNLFNIS